MLTCYPLDPKQNLHWVQISAWNSNSQLSISVFHHFTLKKGNAETGWNRGFWEEGLCCISYPYRKFPSFTEEGTWYCLKSFGLRAATVTLLRLLSMWLEIMTRIFSGLDIKIFHLFFVCFHSQYYVSSLHPSTYSPISRDNEQKQHFRTMNTVAKSKHIHDTSANPQH